MRRYAVLHALLLTAMLVVFGLVQILDVPLLTDAEPLTGQTGVLAGVTGLTLLVIDAALPVPSSVVMVAHGGLFGIAVGSFLSAVGSLGGFAVAFAVGRRGTGVIGRLVGDEEREQADRLLTRWGPVAIILSRPVPILAESVAFAAGASSMRWGPALVAAALASLPMSIVYAAAGAAAVGFSAGAVVFVAVVAVALGVAVFLRPARAILDGSSQ